MKLLAILFLVSCSQVNVKNIPLESPKKPDRFFHVKWVKDLDPVYNTGNLPIGTSSPYIFEDYLYMGNLSGKMTCYDLESGKPVWSKKENAAIQSQVNKSGDFVYYGTKGGRLYSRHYLTGKLNYAIDLGAPIESQPSFYKGRLLIHLRNHTLISLDASTGKIFWRYKRSVPFATTLQRVSQVLPYKDSLLVGFADGHLVSLSLLEGVINWEQKLSVGVKFVDVDVQPVYFNGLIVAGSSAGPMRMLNPDNGVIEKTVELYQSHTPLIVGNELVVGSIHGKVYQIDRYGKVLKSRKISEDGISSISEWKNHYVVTTMGAKIHRLRKDTLTPTGEFDLGSDQSAIFGTSILGDDFLAVYSSRNRLYVFK